MAQILVMLMKTTQLYVVEEIDEILSPQQKNELKQELLSINPSLSLEEDVLINQFAAAKRYVYSCI